MRERRGWYAVVSPLVVTGFLAIQDARLSSVAAETTDALDNPHSLVGSYLAGRFAKAQHDMPSAAEFYRTALTHDPSSELLLEQAFQMEASAANWPQAVKLAEQLVAVQSQHRVANLALALSEFKAGQLKKAEAHFRAAGTGPIGELTSALALAWVAQAQGDTSKALASLDLPKQAEWAQFYLRYHRALIADVAGRPQEARAAYDRALRQDNTRTLRTSLAFARHAAHAGDRKFAATILKEQLDKSQGDGHPLIRSLNETVQSGKKVALMVSTPEEGMSEVFYGLGEALIGEGAVGIGILYLQLALHIEPEQQFALAALANAYEANKQYDDAIAVYSRIPSSSPLESAVEIRKAFNLNSLDRIDEATQTLTNLLDKSQIASEASQEAKKDDAAPTPTETVKDDSIPTPDVLRLGSRGERVAKLQEALKAQGYEIEKADGSYGDGTRRAVMAYQAKSGMKSDGLAGPKTYAAVVEGKASAPEAAAAKSAPSEAKIPLSVHDKLEVLDALGNIMRARKLYLQAVTYYDRALSLVEKPERRHWVYYYARGTSYERLKNWPAAEADLEKALALYPEQPLVLNYLGYSWIDQGRNMKQGMTLIEKAVALKPDDGYIVDSLGWAHFKQGNFKEAVRYLERAVELKPDDPVLNDHLGDALWRVGREREARYQWDEALSLKPEAEDEAKIKKKLETGLSADIPAVGVTGKQAAKTGESESK
jgi:tetratricopeptide (TPR) repeat protein